MKKIAIIFDFLMVLGGGEKVFKEVCDLFPNAQVYTLLYDRGRTKSFFKDLEPRIHTSSLQKSKFIKSNYRKLILLWPKIVRKWDLSEFDLIISFNHVFSKGIKKRKDAKHICYFFTPTRFLWVDRESYLKEIPFGMKGVVSAYLREMEKWDTNCVSQVDKLISVSKTCQMRIKKYYKRNSKVIYPGIDTPLFKISKKRGDYFLLPSRLRPHKKVDLAIYAFNELRLPLKIVGTGSQKSYLQKIAGKKIEFLDWVPNKRLRELYSSCRALIYPQEEDFGLTAIECMASGRPVIAYKKGGATETIEEGVSGLFFDKQCPKTLVEAIKRFDTMEFNSEVIRRSVRKFDVENFRRKFKEFVKTEGDTMSCCLQPH